MKNISIGLLILFSLTAFADDMQSHENDSQNHTQGELSNDCIKSIGQLYRFYFHEIYPNPKNAACKNLSATLGPQETAQMQMVVAEFKNHCPMELVTKINGSFRELQKERDTASS